MAVTQEDLELDLAEWKRCGEIVTRPTVNAEIQARVKSLEHQIHNLAHPAKELRPTTGPEIYSAISSYSWDQTTEFIKLYITIPNISELSAENVSVSFEKESLDLKVRGVPGCPNSRLTIKRLHKEVDPGKCRMKIRKNLISLTLKKAELLWWTDLRPKEQQKMPKMDPDDSKDPGASLMKLMKNLYDEGDEEMKRTIAKAWTESREKEAKGIDPVADLGKDWDI